MKIAKFAIPELNPGKYNIKDSRLDELHKITSSQKKTYFQVEIVDEDLVEEADVIITTKDSTSDLILKDLEFVETRLVRSEDEQEKALLNKLKGILEKEQFIVSQELDPQEKKGISGYRLLTNKPISVIDKFEIDKLDELLSESLRESGFISFFTFNEKETRAWLIKKGTSAYEAAGLIHSDLQRGFIRAEIIPSADIIALGSESKAKQAGKLHLEQKDYIIQEADTVNVRFNK